MQSLVLDDKIGTFMPNKEAILWYRLSAATAPHESDENLCIVIYPDDARR